MNPLFLVAILAVGATASSYGYGEPQFQIRVQDVPAAPLAYSTPSYAEPVRHSNYGSSYQTREHIPILRFNQHIRGGESDSVEFETANGIRSVFNTRVVGGRGGSYQDEYGQLVHSGVSVEQEGHSYHQAPDGQHIALTWRADENGFHASGAHLPVPVPMPAEHAEAHRQALAIAGSSSYGGSSYGGSYAAPAFRNSYSSAPVVIRSGY